MLFIDKKGDAAASAIDAISGEDCVEKLESVTARRTGKSAIALSSIDGAIHTALFLCGAGEGDYVFVPAFTFYSRIAPVDNIGAVPVFIDCEPDTRCLSPAALETAFWWARLQNKPPKAVIVDDAFGSVANYDELMPLCRAWDIPLIELAADGLCGSYKGVSCGANGDYGIIGFEAGLGGGSALILEDKEAALGFVRRRYTEGENHDYGMNNGTAAFDLAFLNTADRVADRARKNIASLCASCDNVIPPTAGDSGAYVLCRAARLTGALRNEGFNVKLPPPVHTLPRYAGQPFFEHEKDYAVCLSFKDCCFVGADISFLDRIKLARMLRAFERAS